MLSKMIESEELICH